VRLVMVISAVWRNMACCSAIGLRMRATVTVARKLWQARQFGANPYHRVQAGAWNAPHNDACPHTARAGCAVLCSLRRKADASDQPRANIFSLSAQRVTSNCGPAMAIGHVRWHACCIVIVVSGSESTGSL
jgi:hypothetical protein